MNKKKKLFRAVALLCAVLMVVNVSLTNVSAGSSEDTQFTPLTFSDFGFSNGDIESNVGGEVSGKTLENVVFTGDVKFNGAQLRYLLFNGWAGLRFDFDKDYIRVIANGGTAGDWWIYKESLELTSFQDVMFRLTISLEKTNETDALLKVAYNGTEILSQTLAGAYGTSGYLNNAALTFDSATAEYPITIASVVNTMTPLTFSDFGFSNGDIEGNVGGEATGKTLENVVFTGDLKFNGAQLRYLLFNGWAGLRFDFDKDYIRVIANGGAVGDWWIYKESLELTSFQDVMFRLTISLKKTNATDALLKVSYDGTEVLSQTLTGAYGASGYLNNAALTFDSATAEYPITIASYSEAEGGDETVNYTELKLTDIGLIAGKVGGDEVIQTQTGTLQDTAITGIYKFSNGGNHVYFGGYWQGFRITPTADGELGFWYVNLNTNPVTELSLGTVTAEAAQVTALTGTDVKIRTAFAFSNVNETANTANVKVSVNIGDSYENSFDLTGVSIDTFLKKVFVYSSSADTPISYRSEGEEAAQDNFRPSEDLTDITPADFGLGSIEMKGELSASYEGATLDGTRLTMNISIPNNPSEGTYLRFGGQGAGWEGIGIRCSGDGSLIMQDWKTGGDIKATFTPEVAGVPALLGTQIKLTITTEFIDADNDSVNDDVMLGVYFGDRLYNDRTVILMNRTADFGKALLLYTDNAEYPIILDVPEEEKPELRTVTLQEMGISNAKYAYDNDQMVANGVYEGSLLNTVLTQKITFSAHADNWMNYAGNNSPWLGIRFKTLEDGSIWFAAADGEFSESGVLLPTVAGTDLVGKEIEMAIELIESGENVKMGIYFNGIRYNNQYFTLTGAASKLGSHVGFYVKDAEGYITIGTPEATPTINADFTNLTFDSYNIESGTYGYNDNQLSVSGAIKKDSLDQVVFSDTVNFSDTGVQLRIGGTDSPWKGLVWQSVGNGQLLLSPAEGGFTPISFDSKKAGVQLTENDIEFAVSFEYVDSDGDGKEDDVKMGVWFDGKAYNDRWIYLKDYASSLGGHLGIYCSEKDASFTLQTYMPPIDFAEFGFTVRWAYTLGLKK